MKRALILANGKPPSKRLFTTLFANTDCLICADGGANIAARFGVAPDMIIGDLDSIFKETLAIFKNVKTIKLKDQNSTDLEKALSAAIKNDFSEIAVLGATGGRLDHAIGNLSALVKFSNKAQIKFSDDTGEYIHICNALEFNPPIGTTISLLPLSLCSGIVSKGLKWNLKNESLQFGIRESTSNIVVSSPVSIKIGRGNLVVFVMNNIQKN
jgi:thiamine pyrophosphokinase